MAFFLRILARDRLGIGLRGTRSEYEQDYGKGVTHWVHLDELGIRQGQNAQLNALTLLRSGSVAAYQNGFDRSLRFAWRGRRPGRPHIPTLSREHHRRIGSLEALTFSISFRGIEQNGQAGSIKLIKELAPVWDRRL